MAFHRFGHVRIPTTILSPWAVFPNSVVTSDSHGTLSSRSTVLFSLSTIYRTSFCWSLDSTTVGAVGIASSEDDEDAIFLFFFGGLLSCRDPNVWIFFVSHL